MRLPDGQRLVTVLFYVSGYPQYEIAEFLNVPLTTVKKRLQAARKQLHERLMTLMEDDGLEQYGRDYLPSQTVAFMRTVRILTSFDWRPVLELLLIDGLDVNAVMWTDGHYSRGQRSADSWRRQLSF